MDQITYGPVCNIMFMSFTTLALERKSLDFLIGKLDRDYPTVQRFGWRLWPLASLLNYKLVPVHLRVLFMNIVAFCWSVFLLLKSRAAVTIKA